MLRAVVENARLVDHVGQVLGMPRRKAVVPARLDVQQFVERVAVGQPGGAFLVGAEQVAQPVETPAPPESESRNKPVRGA